MSDTLKCGKYTQDFKEKGVRQVLAGASIGSVAESLGIPNQPGQLGSSATPRTARR